MLNKTTLSIFFTTLSIYLQSQIKIVNSMFNAYNVSPEVMLFANILNNDIPQEVYLESTLFNGLNKPVVIVKSGALMLKTGLNATAQMQVKVASAQFTGSSDGVYIQTMHQLPSGRFRYCITIKPVSGSVEDDLCEEFENESSSQLFLTSPADKEVIETLNPVFLWNHSDPFSVMQQGEMFRLVVTELKKDQSAEQGLTTNSPLLISNFLTRHDVMYPFDAPKLEAGKRYAWQVQKMTNNVITNKTEAGEFTMQQKADITANKYIEIGSKPNTSTYLANGNKIYFSFNEEYYSPEKKLTIRITPENQATLNDVRAKDDKAGQAKYNLKETGYNKYEVDLNESGLESGFHTLNITNVKGQAFQLKFYIQ